MFQLKTLLHVNSKQKKDGAILNYNLMIILFVKFILTHKSIQFVVFYY